MRVVQRHLHCGALEAAAAVGPGNWIRRWCWCRAALGDRSGGARAACSKERDENQDHGDAARHLAECTECRFPIENLGVGWDLPGAGALMLPAQLAWSLIRV